MKVRKLLEELDEFVLDTSGMGNVGAVLTLDRRVSSSTPVNLWIGLDDGRSLQFNGEDVGEVLNTAHLALDEVEDEE